LGDVKPNTTTFSYVLMPMLKKELWNKVAVRAKVKTHMKPYIEETIAYRKDKVLSLFEFLKDKIAYERFEDYQTNLLISE